MSLQLGFSWIKLRWVGLWQFQWSLKIIICNWMIILFYPHDWLLLQSVSKWAAFKMGGSSGFESLVSRRNRCSATIYKINGRFAKLMYLWNYQKYIGEKHFIVQKYSKFMFNFVDLEQIFFIVILNWIIAPLSVALLKGVPQVPQLWR